MPATSTTIERLPDDPWIHDRVRAHTPTRINERIDAATEETVVRYLRSGRKAIERRLRQLEREWDIDRVLVAAFAVIGGVLNEIGPRRSRPLRWLGRSQVAFQLMYELFGWCPPMMALRRLGVRTQHEIDAERGMLIEALRILYGA